MRRDDYERRRIRDIYDRNVRRVRALADARDRYRTDRDGDVLAPRRFIVSERRSRLEGFGYGDRRPDDRYWSRAHGSYRFDDRRVYRRVGLGRFVREDDYDREYRRERARSRDVERYRRGYGPRFGRLRLRPREIRQSRMYGGKERRRYRLFRRQRERVGDVNSAAESRKRAEGTTKQRPVTKKCLDEELDQFRGSN